MAFQCRSFSSDHGTVDPSPPRKRAFARIHAPSPLVMRSDSPRYKTVERQAAFILLSKGSQLHLSPIGPSIKWDRGTAPGLGCVGGNIRAQSSLRERLKVLRWFKSQYDKPSEANLSFVHGVFSFAGGSVIRARDPKVRSAPPGADPCDPKSIFRSDFEIGGSLMNAKRRLIRPSTSNS